jgi:hypothetical protein
MSPGRECGVGEGWRNLNPREPVPIVRAMGVPARPDVESSVPNGVIVEGRFEKVRVRPLRRFGTYRREGSIGVSSDGLTISGRHVLPAPIRLAIGIPLCALTLVVGYGVVEYLLLKEETLIVPWSAVDGFVVDRQLSRIAFTFQGKKETGPVVFRTARAQWLYATMQQYVPAKDLGAGCRQSSPAPSTCSHCHWNSGNHIDPGDVRTAQVARWAKVKTRIKPRSERRLSPIQGLCSSVL